MSSSANTEAVLKAAGVDGLFEVRVDHEVAEAAHLRGKPAPDTFLEAARLLGVAPANASVYEDALAGVRSISSLAVDLSERTFEQQLVVDLQDQAGVETACGDRAMTADHRDLDDVGGGALDHGVDGEALAERRCWRLRARSSGIWRRRPSSVVDVALLDGLRDRSPR